MIIDKYVDPPEGWVIDSGATRHMTSDESVFIIKRTTNSTVTVVNGQALKAQGIGEIKFDLGGKSIVMKDVLWVSDLNANLLSISALNRKGLSVMFHKDDVEVRKKGILVATGIARGRMYFLRTANIALLITEGGSKIPEKSETAPNQQSVEATPILAPFSGEGTISEKNANNQEIDQPTEVDSEKSEKFPQAANQKEDVWRLWHERLGHVSPVRMKLLTGQMIDMEVGSLSKKGQLLCEICDYFKLTRRTHRDSLKRASRRLERVHTDV